MVLVEELEPFFRFMEVHESKTRMILDELQQKELIQSKSQLFLLEDKSWEHVTAPVLYF